MLSSPKTDCLQNLSFYDNHNHDHYFYDNFCDDDDNNDFVTGRESRCQSLVQWQPMLLFKGKDDDDDHDDDHDNHDNGHHVK